jgi:hypothetical protein
VTGGCALARAGDTPETSALRPSATEPDTVLDDFFTGAKEGKRAQLSCEELAEIRRGLRGLARKLEIFVTLCAHPLDLPIGNYLEWIQRVGEIRL